MRPLLLLAALALAALTPRWSCAQAVAARLVVTVTDHASGEPVPGAQVRITSAGIGAITNDSGRAQVAGISPGNHLVVVQRLGYTPESMLIEFGSGAAVEGEIALQAAALTLSRVEVTAQRDARLERRGFYDRRERNGFGTFLTEEEIEQRRRSGGPLTSLLRTIPGLTVEYHPRTGRPLVFVTRGNDSVMLGRCQPRVFLDGVRVPVSADLDIDQLIVPNEIGAIEVYRGASTPLEFSIGRGCGAVVIWTKS